MINLNIDKKDLNNFKEFDTHVYKFIRRNINTEVLAPAGREHYRLIYWLSNQFNDINICDLGTSYGHSAVAASINKSNKVRSVDIINIRDLNNEHLLENVEFQFISDLVGDKSLLNSFIIILDVGLHEGIYETKLINWLIESNYEGIVLVDDYGDYFPGIKNMVDNLNCNKLDVTPYGHFTGTAILNFSKEITFNLK